MFEEGAWLPPRRPPRQDGIFAVPRIPTQPIIRAAYTYGPGREFTLLPNFFFPTSDYEIEDAPRSEKATIRIIQPVSIGYHHRSQICLVEIIEHETLDPGTKAIMRVYDPLYIRPDSLHTISLPPTQTHPGPSDSCAQTRPSAQVFAAVPDNVSEACVSTHRSHSPSFVSSSKATYQSPVIHEANFEREAKEAERSALFDAYNVPAVLPYFGYANMQEYSEFSDISPLAKPTRGWLPPARYTNSMFTKEIKALETLRPLQGDVVPTLYGQYHIEIPEREWPKDKVVYVSLLEFVEGVELSASIISQLTDGEAQSLWDSVDKSIKLIHETGVIRRNRLLRKVLWNTETGRITFTDFAQGGIIASMSEEQVIAGKNSDIGYLFDRFEEAMNE